MDIVDDLDRSLSVASEGLPTVHSDDDGSAAAYGDAESKWASDDDYCLFTDVP